jgi:protein-arginine kinase activator protein McsA
VTTKAAARTDPSTLLGDAQERAQKIQSLQRQLEEAVRAEQYERAATIRDEMRRLSGLESQTRHSSGRGG